MGKKASTSTVYVIIHINTAQVVEIIPRVRRSIPTINIMDADVLATHAVRASASIILTMLERKIRSPHVKC